MKEKIFSNIKNLVSKGFVTFSSLEKEMKLRIISSFCIIPLSLFIVYKGGVLFSILLIAMAVICSFEFKNLTNSFKNSDEEKRNWNILGILYIIIPFASISIIRGFEDDGFDLTVLLLLLVWATDIAAFFVGRSVGGEKLCPSISPNKTVSGAIGGLIASIVIATLYLIFVGGTNFLAIAFLAGTTSAVAQMGDLFESWLKRKAEVKDSSNLIPGHGGLLDRIDGLMFAAPYFLLMSIMIF